MNKKQKRLTKGDNAMLAAARMQILLEKNIHWFAGPANEPNVKPRVEILQECYDIIKKAKIPKKYLVAETLDTSTNI
jgi:hypothetical protein